MSGNFQLCGVCVLNLVQILNYSFISQCYKWFWIVGITKNIRY